MIRGIIFDLDGTLIESPLDFSAIRREVACKEGFVLEFILSLPSPRREECYEILLKHEVYAAFQAKLKPGAREVFDFLERNEFKKALVTRNSRQAVEIVCERLSLRFDVIVTREDAPPKPSPQPLLLAGKLLELEPRELIHIGDNLIDHTSAERANIRSIIIDPSSSEPHALPSLYHIIPLLKEGLPLL